MTAELTADLVRRLRLRRERDARGLFLLEGVAPFLHACSAGLAFESVVHSRILLRSPAAQKRVRILRREGVPAHHLSPEAYRALSVNDRAAGVLAVARQRWSRLCREQPSPGLCWVALERIRSPGNLGTIARTAEAVGAAGLILLGNAVDPHDPAVVRASMGAIFHLRLVRTRRDAFAAWARRTGARVVGTSPRARRLYTELPDDGPMVIFLGHERKGLSAAAFSLCTSTVRLPILGRGDSLNVGVAAGVLLYEALRRRGRPVARAPASGEPAERD